ncbi:hypothetical protein JCM10213_003836 [Rhodosporidiobolus nylandii]
MLRSSWSRSLRPVAPSRRALWTTTTLISPSPAALLAHLESLPPAAATSATLYALSKNTPQDLVPSFRRALAPPGSVAVAGTLSELLPPSLISRLAPSLPPSEAFSISLARYSPSGGERVVPWRSSLTGRPNIALGREIKPELHALSEGEEGAFEAFLRGEKWSFGAVSVGATEPPKDAIEGIEREDPKDVSQILCFTADRLQPFLSVLSSYPSAAVAGLVGSSTPFHSPSHDPYSLFLDEKETFSSGAVGLAVVRDGSAQTDGKVEARLNYGGLKKLGSEMEVTSSRGNIVLTLSSQNAARTLLNEVNNLFGTAAANLSALQRSEEKEKEFYAAIFSEKPVSPLDLSKARLVAKINAGDPSRGAMSVETEEEVRQGDWLVFLHRPASLLPSPDLRPSFLTFLALPPSYSSPHFSTSECPADGEVVAIDGFLAASENGVVHLTAGGAGEGRRGRLCAIEGAGLTLGC